MASYNFPDFSISTPFKNNRLACKKVTSQTTRFHKKSLTFSSSSWQFSSCFSFNLLSTILFCFGAWCSSRCHSFLKWSRRSSTFCYKTKYNTKFHWFLKSTWRDDEEEESSASSSSSASKEALRRRVVPVVFNFTASYTTSFLNYIIPRYLRLPTIFRFKIWAHGRYILLRC